MDFGNRRQLPYERNPVWEISIDKIRGWFKWLSFWSFSLYTSAYACVHHFVLCECIQSKLYPTKSPSQPLNEKNTSKRSLRFKRCRLLFGLDRFNFGTNKIAKVQRKLKNENTLCVECIKDRECGCPCSVIVNGLRCCFWRGFLSSVEFPTKS